MVDVEITDWPSATQNPRGHVIEILGQESDFGVDVEIMIRKFGLPHRFPPEVIEEARPLYSENEIISRRIALPPPRLSRPSQSSPSTAKPPATSTMPSTSANWQMETTNSRSTSPTSRNM